MADEKPIDRNRGRAALRSGHCKFWSRALDKQVHGDVGPMVKIVFMEQGGAEERLFFRSAVTMSHQDAIALKTLLARMLADIEKQIEAFQAGQAGAETPPNA